MLESDVVQQRSPTRAVPALGLPPEALTRAPRLPLASMWPSARAPHELQAPPPGGPVADIMSRAVVAMPASTTVEAATRIMLERRISGAPVVDDAGRPVGIVSKTDLLEAWHEHARQRKEAAAAAGAAEPAAIRPASGEGEGAHVVVGDIMVPYLLAAQSSSPITLAAALMAYEGVHRLIVLDEQSSMVGMLTSLDILRWLGQLCGMASGLPGPA